MSKRTYKRRYSILFLLFSFAFAQPSGAAISFSDVDEENTFYVPVYYLANRGLVEGYKDGTFKPDKNINRAEAIHLLFTAFSQVSLSNKNISVSTLEKEFNFPDVKLSDWFYSSIKKAWMLQIVKGYSDGLYHPERTMNRAEALKTAIIIESIALTEGLPALSEPSESPFPDVEVDTWFAPYAKIAKDRTLSLPSRSDGSINPDYQMSRGDFAMLLYRLLRSRDGILFGRATWYDAGSMTASGDPFDPNKMTAAHPTLPFGTMILVRNLANGKTVTVTINDRGPFSTGIHLDLSRAAFDNIAHLNDGIILIEYEEIKETYHG